jgi:hypothetical protein
MNGYDIHTTLTQPRFPGQATTQQVTASSTTHSTSVINMMTKYGGQQWSAKCLTPGCNYTHTAPTHGAAKQAGDQHTANAN